MDTFDSRTKSLIGEDKLNILKNSHIIVFGLGGVGSFVVEALVRSGVGTISIVDSDKVSNSNINRQIFALNSTLGRNKVDVAEERIKDINPDCKVIKHNLFYLPDNASEFDFSNYDYVVDAIDTVSAKIDIIKKSKAAKTKIISSMGTGNKLHPEMFEISDIFDTSVCPLAKVMRKLCKENSISELKVLYSKEEPVINNVEEKAKRVPSSISFVPSTAGLLIASTVINDLISDS